MNLIAPLIRPENVVVDLEAASKKRLFELVGQLFQSSCGLLAGEVFESLFSREKLGSTALGYGVAIPHARIKGLKDAACACIRLKTPIDFDAPDNLPVDLVFILLAPATASDLHLQILGELAQMLGDPGFRARLRQSPDAESFQALVKQWAA